MIKINKNKVIGEVIFVVEGRVDEANIIRDIFIVVKIKISREQQKIT